MRTLILTLVACVALVMPVSCMQHNGNIGDYFGSWKLESIIADGEPRTDYRDNLFFQFQSTVLGINSVEAHHTSETRFGTWEEKDSQTLLIEFGHKADGADAATRRFTPPAILELNPDGITVCHIDELNSKHMRLSYTGIEHQQILLTFKKQ